MLLNLPGVFASAVVTLATEENRPQRYYMEGVLSFVKGCDAFSIGFAPEAFQQISENPSVYAKLSCFLPWVAKQYGLSYDGDPSSDQSCTQSNGQRPTGEEICRATGVVNLFYIESEYQCIFPFFYQGQLFKECALIELSDFVYPVFRCPVRNSTVKTAWTDPETGEVKMVNDFKNLNPTQDACVIHPPADAPFTELASINPEINPGDDNCPVFDEETFITGLPPFSVCKNDCPGGKGCVVYFYI